MLPGIGDSARLWQRPGLRQRFVLAVVGALVAVLCAFILTGKEAQARTNLPGHAGGPVKEVHGKAAESAGQTSRGAADHVDSSTPNVDGPARLDSEPAGGGRGGAIESAPQMIQGPGRADVGPVLEEAAQKVDPTLKAPSPTVGSLASPSDPVLETATPVVGSISKATTQAIEPVSEPAGTVLKEAAPAIEPIGKAVKPVTGPLLGATSPIVEPALETASPVVEPANGATAPVVEPIFDPVAPAGGSVFGEGAVKGGELSVLARIADTTSASPSTISSPALTAEAWSTSSDPRPAPATLGNAPGSPSNGSAGKTQASMVGLSGSHHFELFDRPLTVSGHQAALLGAIAADATERTPHPFPFGFPSGIPPPVGSSLGGFGIGFNLLGVLVLLLALSRVGGWLRSTREAFELGPYLQLAIERPG